MPLRLHHLLAYWLAVGISGCAVHPAPLTDVELVTAAAANQSGVVDDQEPVAGAVSLYEAMACPSSNALSQFAA